MIAKVAFAFRIHSWASVAVLLICSALCGCQNVPAPALNPASADGALKAPYPPSRLIRGITWHWQTLRTAAVGSDLWPLTWGPDGQLYAAWG
jgi:hypothetical protein